jgi:hypothetical protein
MKFLWIILVILLPSVKADDQYLISQMEGLRNSLAVDDPARVELTLRLADLYFDVSIREGRETTEEMLKEHRKRALSLYSDPLSGTNGIPRAEGELRIKIEFQMARLLTRLDDGKQAEAYYLSVFNNPKSPTKVKEQSALALAEWYEEQARFKDANHYYQNSIKLCDGIETCNYAHYRRAWLLYKESKLDEAIVELEKSLWDPQGNIKENSLQDYLMFLSNRPSDGLEEFAKIKKLSQKIKRPHLTRDLMEAFYVAGNRQAGSNTLDLINTQTPNTYYEIRLLEEFYGFRNWEQVEVYLNKLAHKSPKDLPLKKEEADEANKILRRLLVQLDAEAQVVKDLRIYLLNSIDIYLVLYPNDDLRIKLQQGWLSAQTDEQAKLLKLEQWINEDLAFKVASSEIRKLRQSRLSLAQKLSQPQIVISEALAIAEILKGDDEAREFHYVAAYELYKLENFTAAQKQFNFLVESAMTKSFADKWAILSQNLLLDLYNKNKNYQAIIAQSTKWLEFSAFQTNELTKENEQMRLVRNQARFEKAFSLGDSKEALGEFMYFCNANLFAEKACPNAKVLAVKLKDQATLIFLLEKFNDEKALMVEYELMGEFAKAAKLNEKFNLHAKASVETYLKVAMLYELEADFANRDRILTKLMAKMKADKQIPYEYESLVYLTLQEANLLDHAALSLPWSLARKVTLANRLEEANSHAQTQSILLSQSTSTGPAWSRLVLSNLQKEFETLSKFGFYGSNGKVRFKRRTNAIESFVQKANKQLSGADSETRVYILQMLKLAYQNLAIEIHSTPIPDGLDAETLSEVMTQLATLAAPFEQVAIDYENLQNSELEQIGTKKDHVLANLESGEQNYATFIEIPQKQVHLVSSLNFENFLTLKQKLSTTFESRDVLSELENFFAQNNNQRLAAYFTGRKEALASENNP